MLTELLTPKKKESSASTQRYIDVEEIREGTVILKNGGLRAILLVSSINFDLKSTEEQEAIVAQYQNFLNSLDFPVQIVVQSRRFNVEPYLELLRSKESEQTNELLRFQVTEYREFIKNLTEVSSIMSKFFYIIVPFSPVENEEGGFFRKMGDIFNQKRTAGIKDELFATYRSQLMQRVNHCMAALASTGVKMTLLGTEEIIELLYSSYNPSIFSANVVKDVKAIELEKTYEA